MFKNICLPSGVDAVKSSEIFQKIYGILLQYHVSWDNHTSFGVDNTKSNIGAVMKFVKPLVCSSTEILTFHVQTLKSG